MRSSALTFLLGATMLVATASTASAQSRCRVVDPTGTPLNIRAEPNGPIIGNLPNGMLVSIRDTARDRAGRRWALVQQYQTGRRFGWVFREFIACF